MGILGENDEHPPAPQGGSSPPPLKKVPVPLDKMSFKVDVEYIHNENSADGKGGVTIEFGLSAEVDDPDIPSHWPHWPELSGTVTYKAPSIGRSGTDLAYRIERAYGAIGQALTQWANDALELSRDELPETDPPIHWFPLSHPNPLPEHSKPSALRFPDGTAVQVRRQYELVVALVEWLRLRSFLQDEELPIRRYNAKDQPLVVMREDRRRLNTGREAADLFVESKFKGPDQAESMRTIVERTGQNPSEFTIQRELVDGV